MIDCLRSLLRPVVCLPAAASVLALALTAGAVAQTAPASSTRSLRTSASSAACAPEVVTLVQYIRTAQQLGFTLAEIGDRLPAIWDAAEPGPALAQVLTAKLREIDERIAALQALRHGVQLAGGRNVCLAATQVHEVDVTELPP